MAFSCRNRVALVTGNSTGLGRQIGLELGRAGAKVPVNFANNKSRGEQALAEYQAAGIETCLVQADVTDQGDVDGMFTDIESQKEWAKRVAFYDLLNSADYVLAFKHYFPGMMKG